ncbi:metallophosphoesterase [Candidatus Woesearchaeota archaeon]|nr:metallophosphoesterase [Candidatus Woesearchaeota archaeon]
MRCVFCADLHGVGVLFQKLEEFSFKNHIRAIILGGDLCPHAHLPLKEAVACQKEFLKGFFAAFCKKMKGLGIQLLVMMGNDDFRANMPALEKLENRGLFQLMHFRAVSLGDFAVVGYSYVPQMPFLLKDWEKLDTPESLPLTDPSRDILSAPKDHGTIQEDMDGLRGLSDPAKTIYAIHAPPYGTKLDTLYSRQHVGSKAVRDFIMRAHPPLTLHGHIHESPEVSGSWKDALGKTLCINPGCRKEDGKLCLVFFDTMDLKKASHYVL